MLVAIDIETQGLDARKFVMGCLIKESGKIVVFDDKKDLWEYLLDMGKKAYNQRKVINVYSHNAQYDFYGYANLKDKNIIWKSHNPFIASYKYKDKEVIKFLDTLGIYRMPLKSIGKIIGLEKFDMPKELRNKDLAEGDKEKIRRYMVRDALIVLESVRFIKNMLKKEGINLKRLYTINQIAIQYLLSMLKKSGDYNHIFEDLDTNTLYKTKYAKDTHLAYRGGRNEAFDVGVYDKVTYIDANSLYGYASMEMRFPDLKTECKVVEPLKLYELNDLIGRIGISKVMIYNKDDKLGLFPVRTDEFNYYPKEDSYIIGVYTHEELKEALRRGYKIINIEWSVIWEEMDNPFREITGRLYKLRNESESRFDYFFYKQMMNCSYGKLAQKRVGREIVIDSIEKSDEFLKNGYSIVGRIKYNYMYQKDEIKKSYTKKYYAPIIPALINAYARVFMYQQLKKIPLKDLIYMDTDSVIFKGYHLNKFMIGKNIGDFKLVRFNERMVLYGRKTYSIGSNIKISGFKANDITIEEFKEGNVKSKKMLTMNTTKEVEDMGKFVESKRNLKEQAERYTAVIQGLKSRKVYIDKGIDNIAHFISDLKETY